jgi:hypothetical protein
MPSNLFPFTARIVSEVKYFDISRDEMVRQLQAGGNVETETEHPFVDDFSNEFAALLRLNISCKHEDARGWTISLKLHKERVDGIDWEPYFIDQTGSRSFGWHRHVWNQKHRTAKSIKVGRTREEFIIRALKELRIALSKVDYESDKLPFN